MRRYPLYVFDLDGTLYRGNEPTPGAVEALAAIRKAGASVRFVTNNSTRRPSDFASHMQAMGFDAEPGEFYTSAMAAAKWLQGRATTAHVVGEEGLRFCLAGAGIEEDSDSPQSVVVGLCRTFDYSMLEAAMQHLLDPAIDFVATNADASYPLQGGRLIPGAGSIVAALSTCSGRTPIIAGKPHPLLIQMAITSVGVEPIDTLVVGDRVDTDIEAGRRAGCDVLLVLTGVETTSPGDVPASDTLQVLAS